jgi:hypothetical protein
MSLDLYQKPLMKALLFHPHHLSLLSAPLELLAEVVEKEEILSPLE